MKTALLAQFLSKYNISSGDVEGVKWKVSSTGELIVRFTSSDESCFGYVEVASNFPEGDYFVANTDTLQSLLNVLTDDTFGVSLKRNSTNTPIAFILSDKRNKVTLALGDVSAAKPNRNSNFAIDESRIAVRSKITTDFVQSFLKSRSALKDVESCTMWSDGTVCETIIGYEHKQNSNRVTLGLDTQKVSAFTHVNFQIKYVADILNVNKAMPSGTLELVAIPGKPVFMRLLFDSPDFKCVYIVNQTND